MAKHGNLASLSSTPVELNAGPGQTANGAEAVVAGEFHLHNTGAALVRVTLWDAGLGANEGYPLAQNEHLTIGHVGSLFVRCPSGTGQLDYLISSGV